MLRIILIAGTALFLSCDFSAEFESVCVDCRCSDSTVRGQWVQECIKNGNNMSDEEMEDVVKACVLSSESLFCNPSRCVKSRGNHGRIRWLEKPECIEEKIMEDDSRYSQRERGWERLHEYLAKNKVGVIRTTHEEARYVESNK